WTPKPGGDSDAGQLHGQAPEVVMDNQHGPTRLGQGGLQGRLLDWRLLVRRVNRRRRHPWWNEDPEITDQRRFILVSPRDQHSPRTVCVTENHGVEEKWVESLSPGLKIDVVIQSPFHVTVDLFYALGPKISRLD